MSDFQPMAPPQISHRPHPRLPLVVLVPVLMCFGSCAEPKGPAHGVEIAEIIDSAGDGQASSRSESHRNNPADELRDAVRRGNVELARSLLAANPNLANTPDTDTDSHYPPLHWAVIDGNVEIAALLLASGANVNARDENHGTTAFFHVRSGEMAKLLLDHGAEYKLKAKDLDETPFRNAVSGRCIEVVEILLELGEKLDFDDAVTLGKTELVAAILKEKPWLAKPPRKPLHPAAGQGNLELCKLLLEHGADPNLDYGFSNVLGPYTPLTSAVTDGHFEITKLLLEHGADPNVSGGKNFDNLFLYAIAYRDARFVESMLEHGADIERGESWKEITPLHVAACLGGTRDAEYVSRVTQPVAPAGDRRQVIEKVNLLLRFGADVNAQCADGSTPSLFAAIAGKRDVCDLLIEHGAKLDIYTACLLGKRAEVDEMLLADPELATQKPYPMKRPLIHWAARAGDVGLVRRLLELGVDPNVEAPAFSYEDAGGFSVWESAKEKGETPLHVAALDGHDEIARLLIEKGAALEATADRNSTPLSYACAGGHETTVRLLLERGATVRLGTALAAITSETGNESVLMLLLDKIDRAELEGQLGTKLLASATDWGKKGAIALLLERNAKPDIFTASALGLVDNVRNLIDADPGLVNAVQSEYPKLPAISLAAQNGHADVVELLISKGAKIDVTKLKEKSLLHEAAEHGHQGVIDLLLARGLKLESRAYDGETLLHAAAGGAQPEIVRFLLAKGADVRAVDFRRNTPLHDVAGWHPSYRRRHKPDPMDYSRVLDVGRLLIEAGSDVNAKDKYGETPLHEAAREGNVELAELLIQSGADVNSRDHRNETPLGYCESRAADEFSYRDPKPVADLLRRHGGVH